MPQAPARRRTQAERSAETRSRLLDATIATLVESGYARTTTTAVCARAGVSNGSLLHHYGTRDRLLRAALEAVYARLRLRVVEGLESLPEGDARIDALVDWMWSVFSSPDFKAVLELWLAGANEPELGLEVDQAATLFDAQNLPTATRLFPEVAERLPDFAAHVNLLFQAMQGMGLVRATIGRRQPEAAEHAETRALLKRWLRHAFREGSPP
jgi:AcrR family transcriptional regulator